MTTPAVISIEDCAAWVPASQHAAVVRELRETQALLERNVSQLKMLAAALEWGRQEIGETE